MLRIAPLDLSEWFFKFHTMSIRMVCYISKESKVYILPLIKNTGFVSYLLLTFKYIIVIVLGRVIEKIKVWRYLRKD